MEAIEAATAFDIGFPMNFLGGPKGVSKPEDVWLMSMAGTQQHVSWPKVDTPNTCSMIITNILLATGSCQEVVTLFSWGVNVNKLNDSLSRSSNLYSNISQICILGFRML
jgi:hypothetical protein